jgi:activating signal cointegrator complex subunit 1
VQEASALAAISSASVENMVLGAAEGSSGSLQRRSRTAHAVDLGTYTIDEIQICRMGSWGPEGEYVSVGGIDIRP